ncbi:MAG: DNA-directed RNA polymerase subunit beta' [Erythrobacter sp.]
MLNRHSSAASATAIARLARNPRIEDLGRSAARFVYALRIIALHERAGRDPIPELAAQLGGVAIAARALALGQAVARLWPENVQLACYCSPVLTHDEVTVGALVTNAANRDRQAFDAQLAGFVRASRIPMLWEETTALVVSELTSR